MDRLVAVWSAAKAAAAAAAAATSCYGEGIASAVTAVARVGK